jgi:hypothetical protein
MAQIETLADRQRAVLAHVVPDPDAWVVHANAAQNIPDPQAALVAKVARWEADYDAAVAAGNYQTRAERDAAGD